MPDQRALAETTAQDMVVGIFDTHDQAAQVVHRLIGAGVPADHPSQCGTSLRASAARPDWVGAARPSGESLNTYDHASSGWHCVHADSFSTSWGRWNERSV
jgi:hypothetical protein